MSSQSATPAARCCTELHRCSWLLLLLAIVCFRAVTLATGATIVMAPQSTTSTESESKATSTTTTKAPELRSQMDNIPLMPRNEPPCLQAGGICVNNGTCPDGFVANVTHAFYLDDDLGLEERLINPDEDLCPDQAKEGVQCCYRVSVSEKRCSAHGGECRSPEACGRAPRQLGANCPKEGTICCILIF